MLERTGRMIKWLDTELEYVASKSGEHHSRREPAHSSRAAQSATTATVGVCQCPPQSRQMRIPAGQFTSFLGLAHTRNTRYPAGRECSLLGIIYIRSLAATRSLLVIDSLAFPIWPRWRDRWDLSRDLSPLPRLFRLYCREVITLRTGNGTGCDNFLTCTIRVIGEIN